MPLIIQSVSKAFGDKQVLDGFSLTVADGGRVGILGPSGGGKSTLLNLVAGLLAPDSGTIAHPYAKTAYVFQECRLLPWLNALENVTAVTGCGKAKAEQLLRALELGDDLGAYPDSLSGGMQQRVNIARALAFDAELVLMDEPFKGLDEALRERVIEVADRYCQGRTVLLVTHDRRECDLLKCEQIYEF